MFFHPNNSLTQVGVLQLGHLILKIESLSFTLQATLSSSLLIAQPTFLYIAIILQDHSIPQITDAKAIKTRV